MAVASKGPTEGPEYLADQVKTLGLAKVRRHVFLCADQSKPKCCPRELTNVAWAYLKKRVKDMGLDQGDSVDERSVGIHLDEEVDIAVRSGLASDHRSEHAHVPC